VPHLQFEMNFSATADEKRRFAAAVVRHFSEIMDTGTDHIAVTLRCFAPEDLTFGRAAPSGGRTAFVDADIRLGRTKDQKRRLALAYIDEIASTWSVAREAVYVIFTEHDGEHFQLSDRVLPSWTAGEDPLAVKPRGGAGAPRARERRREDAAKTSRRGSGRKGGG
jgi:phenylpyruvate tautomerase PptA (4-oxalocrotonate tautomerase family)